MDERQTDAVINELEELANGVAAMVRARTETPGIAIAACISAGVFVAKHCGMDKDDLLEVVKLSLNTFYGDGEGNNLTPKPRITN